MLRNVGHMIGGRVSWMRVAGLPVVGILLLGSCGANSDQPSTSLDAEENAGEGTTSTLALEDVSQVVPFSDEVQYEIGDRNVPRIREDSPISSLELSISTPETVALDQDLVFSVTLANNTSNDIRLEPCPVYFMAFGESSVGVSPGNWIELNCDEAQVVPANDSLSFEMRLEDLEEGGAELDGTTIWWAFKNGTRLSVGSDPIAVVEP